MTSLTEHRSANASLKQALRRRMLAKRQALSVEKRNFYARNLTKSMAKAEIFQQYSRFGIYLPVRGELNLIPALSLAKESHFIAAPRIFSLNINRMWWLKWHRSAPQDGSPKSPTNRLPLNRFGIAEPNGPVSEAIAISSLDCLLMPLTAFDRQGNRLGMGGGFYDRALAHLAPSKRPRLIGVGYDFQAVESLPNDAWDIRMDAVLTPDHYVDFVTRKGF